MYCTTSFNIITPRFMQINYWWISYDSHSKRLLFLQPFMASIIFFLTKCKTKYVCVAPSHIYYGTSAMWCTWRTLQWVGTHSPNHIHINSDDGGTDSSKTLGCNFILTRPIGRKDFIFSVAEKASNTILKYVSKFITHNVKVLNIRLTLSWPTFLSDLKYNCLSHTWRLHHDLVFLVLHIYFAAMCNLWPSFNAITVLIAKIDCHENDLLFPKYARLIQYNYYNALAWHASFC
jgi:hypothetical protein